MECEGGRVKKGAEVGEGKGGTASEKTKIKGPGCRLK